MSVSLIIKSPTQRVDDFKLECDLAWTIGQVKDQITTCYPSKPKKEQQKLIYGGKLLPDHLALKCVLNQTQDVHTMHLVCPLPPKLENASTKGQEVQNEESFSSPPIYSDLNPEWFATQDIATNVPTQANAAFSPMYPTGDPMYQYVVMQQMYSQFMNQYLSQVGGNTAGGGIPSNSFVPPVPETQPVQAPPAAQVPPANQNAAQRAPANENERERDYIDYLYVMSRAVMLFAILYYHSSLSRILLVLTLGMVITMYVRFSRRFQTRAVDAAVQQPQAQPQNEAENARQDPTSVDSQSSSSEECDSETATEEATESSSEETPQEERQPLVTFITTVLTFVSSFFASLIPSDPLPGNAN